MDDQFLPNSTDAEHALLGGDRDHFVLAAEEQTDIAFQHSLLCQVGLPRSRVDGEHFLRQSGDAWLNIQAGYLDIGYGPALQPLPYGALPRLALAWISTHAVRNHTPEIPIGNSAAEFLRLMDMDPDGRRYRTLRKQMHALAACQLQMGFRGRTVNAQPIEQFDAWVANDDHQLALWPGVLRLSDSFYRLLTEHPVPVDNHALLALKGSALAIDIYCWLASRLYRIEGQPVTVRWHQLREQFGQEFHGRNATKNFKKKFVPALNKALAVYPKARVRAIQGGIVLNPSAPPILPKS